MVVILSRFQQDWLLNITVVCSVGFARRDGTEAPIWGNLNILVIIWSFSSLCIILILWKLGGFCSNEHQNPYLDKNFSKLTKVKQDKVHTTGNLSFINLIQQLCFSLMKTLCFTFLQHTSHRNDVKSPSMQLFKPAVNPLEILTII